MEVDTAPPRRNGILFLGGMRATRSTSMRFTEPQGRTEEPPVPPHRSTHSSAPPPYTLRYSTYGFIILSEEEEKKLSRLEETCGKRQFRRSSSLIRFWHIYILYVGAPWMDAILQRGVGKHPQGVCLTNFDDYSTHC
jgi:hypothetical protein